MTIFVGYNIAKNRYTSILSFGNIFLDINDKPQKKLNEMYSKFDEFQISYWKVFKWYEYDNRSMLKF